MLGTPTASLITTTGTDVHVFQKKMSEVQVFTLRVPDEDVRSTSVYSEAVADVEQKSIEEISTGKEAECAAGVDAS